jgi:GntR family transcriptional regulator/MocR family aminotransferase
MEVKTLGAERSARRLADLSWFREITVDHHCVEPLYQQLYTQIRRLIRTQWGAGEAVRLPPTRWLASALGVSRNTVVLAYQRLQEDGYVHGRSGGGTVVSAPTETSDCRPPAAARPTPGPAATGPVFMPPTDLFPAPLWANLTSRRLRMAPAAPGGGAGIRRLREAIATYLGIIRGIRCLPEQVIVTHGMAAGLDLLCRTLTRPGGTIWCEEPGHPDARRVLVRNGLTSIPVPVDEKGLTVASGIAAAPDATLAIVSPARQFPLCVPLDPSRRRQLLDHAEASGMWLVEYDEDTAFLAPGPPTLARRVIHLGTFDSVLFPQLRIGYCVVPDALVDPVGRTLHDVGAFVSELTQEVLADFLDHQRFARILDRVRTAGARRAQLVAEALTEHAAGVEIAGPPGLGGSYVTALFSTPIDDVRLAHTAARSPLPVSPLAACYAGTPLRSGIVLGCAGIREGAIVPAVRELEPLVRRSARRGTGLGTEA